MVPAINVFKIFRRESERRKPASEHAGGASGSEELRRGFLREIAAPRP